MARRNIGHRILMCHNPETELSGEPPINNSDTVFSFLDEDGQSSSLESVNDDVYVKNGDHEEDEENENKENDQGNQFWETQHQNLQAVLCRTTSLESKIRSIAKETVKGAKQSENGCSCRKMVDNGCRNCMMKEVCSRLQNAGFNSAICKSKWKSSADIPSGEHTFIDVVDHSSTRSKGEVRIIVELNFRGEFELAKASEEYNRLVKFLPEVFVGKIERLISLTKILCNAAKKCMKEKKIHVAPWRKQKYMQAKWLKTIERTAENNKPQLSNAEYTSLLPRRPRASMLTMDLLEVLPNLYCAPVVA
ncbi:hypothetical protein BC332_04827 [Capsicum chinense]|nr:hypothetical protein BC332_04827 [Capsicum chinense]